MSDKTIVEEIMKLAPGAACRFDGDVCLELSLADPANVWHGLIRHHSQADKDRIMGLVCRLEQLTSLDLRKCRLNHLPEEMVRLTNLEYLDLASNYLGVVPPFITSLKRLKYLNLAVNDLHELPESFRELTDLAVFKVHKNRIQSIDCLAGCVKLHYVNIYLTGVSSFPSFLDTCPMRNFTCGGFPIGTLPDLTFWPDLDQLVVIGARQDKLPGLPPSLRLLHFLRNRVENIPENIGTLSNLRVFNMHQNYLSHLPESFYNLRLDVVCVTENRLWESTIERLRSRGYPRLICDNQ